MIWFTRFYYFTYLFPGGGLSYGICGVWRTGLFNNFSLRDAYRIIKENDNNDDAIILSWEELSRKDYRFLEHDRIERRKKEDQDKKLNALKGE
jgi:hypothetical protein